jgi:hypothetical protein
MQCNKEKRQLKPTLCFINRHCEGRLDGKLEPLERCFHGVALKPVLEAGWDE